MDKIPETAYLRYLLVLFGAILILYGLTAFWIERFPMRFMDREYPMYRFQKEFVRRGSTESPRLLILGDSRVMAGVMPALLPVTARSVCAGGSTPIETYYLLRQYLDHHPPPETILMAFAPYHLELVDVFWERTVKFDLLIKKEYLEIFRRAEAMNDPVLGSSSRPRLMRKWILYRANFLPYYISDLFYALLIPYSVEAFNLQIHRDMETQKGHYHFGNLDKSEKRTVEAGRNAFIPSPLLNAYLEDTLKLAAARGCNIILDTMPLNRSSMETISPAYREDYRRYLEGLQLTFPLIRVNAEIANWPDTDFGGTGHLNTRGALKMTERVAEYFASP